MESVPKKLLSFEWPVRITSHVEVDCIYTYNAEMGPRPWTMGITTETVHAASHGISFPYKTPYMVSETMDDL